MYTTHHFAAAVSAQDETGIPSFEKQATVKALSNIILALHEVKTHLEGMDMVAGMRFIDDNDPNLEADTVTTIVFDDAYQEFLLSGQSSLFGADTENDLDVLNNATRDVLPDGQISVEDMALAEKIEIFAGDVEDIRTLLVSNIERTGEDEFKQVSPHDDLLDAAIMHASVAGMAYIAGHATPPEEPSGEYSVLTVGYSVSSETAITQAENHLTALRLAIKLIDETVVQGKDILVQLAGDDEVLQMAGLDLDDAITGAEGDVIDTFDYELGARPVLVYAL